MTSVRLRAYNTCMLALFGAFTASAGLIAVAGFYLTRFADRIAEETHLGRVFAGTILLAGATSLPELTVDYNAVVRGQADLATGDLLGSSLINLLILAVMDSVFRPSCRAFTTGARGFAPLGVLSIVLTGLVGVGVLTRMAATWFGVSPLIWAVFGVYVLGLHRTVPLVPAAKPEAPDRRVPLQRKRLLNAGIGYLVATVLLVTAAPYLVTAAHGIALESGLGHGLIGTTLVAFATSLPELVATATAYRMRAPTLAIGNIFGSNAFNMALFLPLDAAFKGPLLGSVRYVHAVTALTVVSATALAVAGQLGCGKPSPIRAETIAATLFAALIALYFLRAL